MFQEIACIRLTPSPTNPRKTFDPVKLAELSDSIRLKGVIQPILVRPMAQFTIEAPGGGYSRWRVVNRNDVTLSTWEFEHEADEEVAKLATAYGFEIVAGERRYRAAGMAGLLEMPCIVREIGDDEVLEMQTIENLQRDDINALEEADGYGELLKRGALDVAAIASRIGKERSYVYDRLSLRDLGQPLRACFLAGEILVTHAVMLSRLSEADQARALEDGLFQPDHGEPELEVGDLVGGHARKAVSIRELERWINRHVRFRPQDADLPNLFPETAMKLAAAEENELKVVKISTEHQLHPDAREESERTLMRTSWKRADGQVDHFDFGSRGNQPSKECADSVLGVLVSGPLRGSAFPVCIAKKKCKVHWPAEVKAAEAAKKRGKADKGTTEPRVDRQAENRKHEEEAKRAEEQRQRWIKAGPEIMKAVHAKLQATDPLDLMGLIIDDARPHWLRAGDTKADKPGDTLESNVRYVAYLILSGKVLDSWRGPHDAPRALKPFGIDPVKIMNAVAPKPKPKAEPAPAKKERKAAGSSAVERIKTAAAAASKKPASKKRKKRTKP